MQNIGCEPLVWESIGGMTPEISSILDSLCRVADDRMGIKCGTIHGKFSARISIDLQCGFHAACTLQRAQQATGSGLKEDIISRRPYGQFRRNNSLSLMRSSRWILRFLFRFFSFPSPNSGSTFRLSGTSEHVVADPLHGPGSGGISSHFSLCLEDDDEIHLIDMPS